MAITQEVLVRLGTSAELAETALSETVTVATEDLVVVLNELANRTGLQIQIGIDTNGCVAADLGRFARILTFRPEQAETIGRAFVDLARSVSRSPFVPPLN